MPQFESGMVVCRAVEEEVMHSFLSVPAHFSEWGVCLADPVQIFVQQHMFGSQLKDSTGV